MKITKAVIPCGGMGTRFLPITKAVPKEILPIIDAPALAYIVDEVVSSGITDIMLILGKGKEAIKDYFSPNVALEDALLRAGKPDLAALVSRTARQANIVYAYQPQPLGSGDALMHARGFTGNEPFCLAFGDDVIHAEEPVMAQLKAAYEQAESHIVGVQYFAGGDITKYGVAKFYRNTDETYAQSQSATARRMERLFRCGGFMEKPALSEIPSRYAALGRYVFTSEIFDETARTKPGKNGEVQLTDAINSLCACSRVYAYDFEGQRYDMGDKLGSIKAAVEFGLRREFGSQLKEYLLTLASNLEAGQR